MANGNNGNVAPGLIGPGRSLLILHPSGRYIRASPVRRGRKLDAALTPLPGESAAEAEDPAWE